MHELVTLRADAVNEQPAPHQVMLFQAALWGPACDRRRAVRRMRPAFSVGGFPLPPFRRDRMLAIDAGMALPPAAGYIENAGRNRDGDGCSSSLLVMPPRPGDPCVNHLHILPRIVRTEHHHPSERIGLVVAGRGLAHHRAGPPMALYPGRAWRIPAGERHHFETGTSALDILVFHPDSARCPTGEVHRMLAAAVP